MPVYHVPGLAAAIKTCMVEWNPCNVVHPTVAAAICRHPAPSLSLWERWPSAARTERVNVEDFNGRYYSEETLQGPLSLGFAEPALPEGEPRSPFFDSP